MATAARMLGTDSDQVVYLGVSWEIYRSLAEDLGEAGRARLTYDGELLEIMSPGSRHERYANRLSELLSVVMHVASRPRKCRLDDIPA